jgi:hypothetical protein
MQSTLWRGLGIVIGGAAGVAGGAGIRSALESGFGTSVLALVVLVAVTVVLYIVARVFHNPDSRMGEVMPGALLGVNTGINVVLLEAILGPIVAGALCVILVLAVVEPLTQSDIYQGFEGWANWLLPMSWPIVAVGLLFLLVSVILHLINLAIRGSFLHIDKVFVDWKTGTIFQKGGLFGNANLQPHSTGYNMGNFAFLTREAKEIEYLTEHEAGHTLNLAALGFVTHLIGALDENVFGGGSDAYTELLAESNVPEEQRQGPIFPMWGESPAAPAGGPGP